MPAVSFGGMLIVALVAVAAFRLPPGGAPGADRACRAAAAGMVLVRAGSSSSEGDEFCTELGALTARGGGRLDSGLLAELGSRFDTVFPGLSPGTVRMRNEPS